MNKDRLSFLNKMIKELQQRLSAIVKPETVYRPVRPPFSRDRQPSWVLTYEIKDYSLHDKLAAFLADLGYEVTDPTRDTDPEDPNPCLFDSMRVDVTRMESDEEFQKRTNDYEAKLEEYEVENKRYREYLSAMERYNTVDRPLIDHMSQMIDVLKQEVNKILEENGIQKNKKGK